MDEVWVVFLDENWKGDTLESIHETRDGAVAFARSAWNGALKDGFESEPDEDLVFYIGNAPDTRGTFHVTIQPWQVRT